jgi:hypothetical protein
VSAVQDTHASSVPNCALSAYERRAPGRKGIEAAWVTMPETTTQASVKKRGGLESHLPKSRHDCKAWPCLYENSVHFGVTSACATRLVTY